MGREVNMDFKKPTYEERLRYLIPSARPVDLTLENERRQQAAKEMEEYEEKYWSMVLSQGLLMGGL